jgi:hypothetical protein
MKNVFVIMARIGSKSFRNGLQLDCSRNIVSSGASNDFNKRLVSLPMVLAQELIEEQGNARVDSELSELKKLIQKTFTINEEVGSGLVR